MIVTLRVSLSLVLKILLMIREDHKYNMRVKILNIFLVFIMAVSVSVSSQENSDILNLLSSEGKILFGNEPNSLLVIDYPENISRVDQYLDMVDVSPQQVIIEARVVEAALGGEHSLGVNWTIFADKGSLDAGQTNIFSSAIGDGLQQQIPFKNTEYPPGATTTTTENPFTLTIFDENINVVIQALENQLDTTILSAPSVTTVNNREAEIKIIEKIPWAEPEVTTLGESATAINVTWTVNFEEVGITLTVTPTISEDGNISMILEPEISEHTKDLTLTVISGDQEIDYTVPFVDLRAASTKVVVGNGQTLIIGGLINTKKQIGETKIPLLGDIPWLGYLFKSEKKTIDKTELLIFVSPTIITSGELNYMGKLESHTHDKWEGKRTIIDEKSQEDLSKKVYSYSPPKYLPETWQEEPPQKRAYLPISDKAFFKGKKKVNKPDIIKENPPAKPKTPVKPSESPAQEAKSDVKDSPPDKRLQQMNNALDLFESNIVN